SIGFASEDKGQARQMMERYILYMASGLQETLMHDTAVRQNAFDEIFTPAEFINVVISGLLSILVQHKSSCSVLLEMIRRTLY
ncbi:MAG: TetR/AcrR family transcriptional regulator, partial [Clostridiales bacterium]